MYHCNRENIQKFNIFPTIVNKYSELFASIVFNFESPIDDFAHKLSFKFDFVGLMVHVQNAQIWVIQLFSGQLIYK